MGWFGGSSESSSSDSNLSGGSGDYGSKLRTPSSELDLSDYSGSNPLGGAGGGDMDIQQHLQKEQQKAMIMSAVSHCLHVLVVIDDVLVVEVIVVVVIVQAQAVIRFWEVLKE